MAITVLGLSVTPVSWALYEWIEISATIGLAIGVVVSWMMLQQSLKRAQKAESIVNQLSGSFMQLVQERFAQWDLTPAQKDVALFLVKGMTTSEMAALRGTSEGTIKAQTNAIYRKADVTSRAQLVSLFVDDLLQDDALPGQPEFEPDSQKSA